MQKKRLYVLLAAITIHILCAITLCVTPLESTTLKIFGSFAALILAAAVCRYFPFGFYCASMGFVILASSLGSCLNLYRYLGFYDLFVHYLSGIVLAEGGRLLIGALCQRRSIALDRLTQTLFSVLFSCTGAALWEIYEFCADLLLHAQMQGSLENTMGDIICGVLGALTCLLRLKKCNKTPE